MKRDFLDEDVAYLLGMITARGVIQNSRGIHRIINHFPYSSLETDDVRERNSLLVSLDRIQSRVSELSEISAEKIEKKSEADLMFSFRKRNILWRDVNMLFQGQRDFKEFTIPLQILDAETSIKKEFIRGFADVNGKVRRSNRYFGDIHRVYLDVLNDNWNLPIQLCHLLQDHLSIPVQTLTWGHPNLRNKPEEPWTKREHQLKIFCEDFIEVGFYIEHKQEALQRLADENIEKEHKSSFCTPPRRRGKKNPPHPDENHPDLPSQIKGKHYDSYWAICRDMGCYRWAGQTELVEEK